VLTQPQYMPTHEEWTESYTVDQKLASVMLATVGY